MHVEIDLNLKWMNGLSPDMIQQDIMVLFDTCS